MPKLTKRANCLVQTHGRALIIEKLSVAVFIIFLKEVSLKKIFKPEKIPSEKCLKILIVG